MRCIFKKLFKSQENIISLKEFTLTTIGMRFTHLYKAVRSEEAFKLERYKKTYSNGKDGLELEISAMCTETKIIELMNRCNVTKWDGFHGKHPKNVSDGIMFNFFAVVNEEKTIKADGSANFPKGYYDFVRTLDKMLSDASMAYKEKNSKNLQAFHTDLTFGIEEKILLDVNKKQLLLTVKEKPYVINKDEIIDFEGIVSELSANDNDKGYRFCLNLNVNTPLFDIISVDLTKGNRPNHPDEDHYLECNMQLLELKSWLREWTYTPTIEQTFLG